MQGERELAATREAAIDQTAPARHQHIVLVGLMGSGKTAVGRLLAERTGRPFVDSDDQLEEHTGATAAELASREGPESLHDLEWRMLETALDRPDESVVTAAASVVDSPRIFDLLAGHRVIWLTADLEELARRVADPGHRPFIDDDALATLQVQARSRRARYAQAADIVVDTTELMPPQVVDVLLAEIGEASPGPARNR